MGPRTSVDAKLQRQLSRPVNRELRLAGLPVPRQHRCFEVTISAIAMPAWAIRKALAGFKQTSTTIVLKARGDALELARVDRAQGGKPTVDRFEYRKCNACGRLLIREDAAAMREWERLHPNEKAICGPNCMTKETTL